MSDLFDFPEPVDYPAQVTEKVFNKLQDKALRQAIAFAPGSGGGGAELLGDLLDVVIVDPEDLDSLIYDSGSGLWTNQPTVVQGRLLGTATYLDGGSDVTVNWNNGLGSTIAIPTNSTVAVKVFAVARGTETARSKTSTFVYLFKTGAGSTPTGFPNPLNGDVYIDELQETGTTGWEITPSFVPGGFQLFVNCAGSGEDVNWAMTLEYTEVSD